MTIRTYDKQCGQVLFLGMFFILLAFASILLLFNLGKINNEKQLLVNAVDAAVYSAGVYYARNLNFIAYTNRAMVANHVAVGHYMSYVSWVRYVHGTVEKLDSLTNFLPSIKTMSKYAKKLMHGEKKYAEKVAIKLLHVTDSINETIENAQLSSQYAMNGVLSISSLLDVKIMDKVAKTYHPSIRVNYKKDVVSVKPLWLRNQIIDDISNTLKYVKRYKVGNDNHKMKKIIQDNYIANQQWIIGNRGWYFGGNHLGLFKEGSTNNDSNNKNWVANDKLVEKRPSLFKKRNNIVVSSGSANALEFKSNYKGLNYYYDNRERKRPRESVYISALGVLPIAKPKYRKVDVNSDKTIRLEAVARAEIYYIKDTPRDMMNGTIPQGLLYNPYWSVRLTVNTKNNNHIL